VRQVVLVVVPANVGDLADANRRSRAAPS